MPNHLIATRIFGQTDREVTAVGLGGEGVLRTHAKNLQARQVILEALSEEISYFDSAHVYADSELYYGSVWSEQPERRSRVFQASKSAGRNKQAAQADLDKTLQRLKTDYLDLWQIHDVRSEADLDAISGPGGALEAFTDARSSGKVRAIGVTGHHDPAVLTRAVTEWPVDAVMMPVNPIEESLGGFLTSTLPAARSKGIAVIAMKILGASHYINLKLGITPELLIRFALSHDISVAIVGCSNRKEVQTLAGVGASFQPLSGAEKQHIRQVFDPYATQLAFYRGVI